MGDASRRCTWIVVAALGFGVLASGSIAQAGDEVTIVDQWNDSACNTGADVWGEGDYAYWGHFGGNCLDILDVSVPSDVQWVGSFSAPPPDQSNSLQDVRVHNGLAYLGYGGDNNNGAAIVDVRDPGNAVQLTTLRVTAGNVIYSDVHNLFYHEGYLYLADSRTNTFAVVDLSDYDPDNNPPAQINEAKWHMTNVGSQIVHDFTALKDRLYVSAWDEIIVYDISNIANEPPVFLGSAPGQSSHANWATDDERFIVTAEERSGGGIKLYEVTEVGDGGGVDITLLDEVVDPGAFSAHNPIIVCNRVYTSWYESGLLVHEIDADAGQLVEVGRVDPGTIWGVYPLLGLDRVILGGFGGFYIADATLDSVPCDDETVILPEDFIVVRGLLVSGNLEDLWNSDDSYVIVRPAAFAPQPGPPVQVEVIGTSVNQTPAVLRFKQETHMEPETLPDIEYEILFFNYDTQEYDLVDFRTRPGGLDDKVTVVEITDNPGRYIDDKTGQVDALMTFKAVSFSDARLAVAHIDQATWSFVP
ncbi:MAG: hypothetical protein IID39_05330 [Planctomycetes bacterium]|nr:hypothetical protein [Planctomycetota bacterium]